MSTLELTQQNFVATLDDERPIIIDFWAPWCAPCRQFAPVFDLVATRHPDVVFAKVNTEAEQALATEMRIRSIPTLMVFRDRVLLFQHSGALREAEFEDLVQQIKAVDMKQVHAEIAASESGSSAN